MVADPIAGAIVEAAAEGIDQVAVSPVSLGLLHSRE